LWTANVLRGAFGSALKRLDEKAYQEFFRPTAQSIPRTDARAILPSGLNDLPRPFVFRLRESEIGINLFRISSLDLVCRVMSELDLELAASPEILWVSLAAPNNDAAAVAQRLRIRFLTPTELKGSTEPGFGPLLARIRDRISTLRALYGTGPLDLDFRAFGERADSVRMTRCELQTVQEERISKGTGQRHGIGGFTGFAEYGGLVGEFIPYLEAARWTGVGRQTVWGKGEIEVELLHD
jgi:CRISPR-associated endoribonuclease Cas6